MNVRNLHIRDLYTLRPLRAVFGGMRPQDVTAQHVYQYMDIRNAPVAANRGKSLLSAIFNYAVRKGIVASNPCRQVTRLTEKPRTRYIRDNEYEAVWNIAPPMIRCAMDLAYITGLRQGDILALNFRDHVKKDGLQVTTGKTGTRVWFSWDAGLTEVVERCKKARGKSEART
jgi:integrase